MAISTCTACGEIFHSVTAFDKHRIGTFEPNTRHCMTTDEMIDAGLDIDKKGHWVTELMSQEIALKRAWKEA